MTFTYSSAPARLWTSFQEVSRLSWIVGTAAVKATNVKLVMTIAEEIASLSRSPNPIGIDVPLKHSGLDPKTLSSFHAWLKSAHDYDASFSRLLEDDTTAEVLATDILGASPYPSAAAGS